MLTNGLKWIEPGVQRQTHPGKLRQCSAVTKKKWEFQKGNLSASPSLLFLFIWISIWIVVFSTFRLFDRSTNKSKPVFGRITTYRQRWWSNPKFCPVSTTTSVTGPTMALTTTLEFLLRRRFPQKTPDDFFLSFWASTFSSSLGTNPKGSFAAIILGEANFWLVEHVLLRWA